MLYHPLTTPIYFWTWAKQIPSSVHIAPRGSATKAILVRVRYLPTACLQSEYTQRTSCALPAFPTCVWKANLQQRRLEILAAMVKPGRILSIDLFLRRAMAEIEDSVAAGATDVQSMADALNTRGFTTRNGRQWTAATIDKLLSSSRAGESSRAIKIR